MKILRHVEDLLQDLLLGAVEIVLDGQNLLAQVAEVISLRKIEMIIITERSLMADVQNLLEAIGTKKIGVQDHLYLVAEVIDTKKIGDRDLPDQTIGVINTRMKDVQDRL